MLQFNNKYLGQVERTLSGKVMPITHNSRFANDQFHIGWFKCTIFRRCGIQVEL